MTYVTDPIWLYGMYFGPSRDLLSCVFRRLQEELGAS
jgi:hypothetical protein